MNKTLFLLGLTMLFSSVAKAQATFAFGWKAGLNLASEISVVDGKRGTTLPAASYHVGLYLDKRIKPTFAIQPGLFIQGKGGEYKEDGYTYTDKLTYLEIPLNFVFYMPLRKGELFYGLGPYAAFGLSAKIKRDNITVDLEWGDRENQIRQMDAGVNFLTGYKFESGVVLGIASGIGLINLSNRNNASFRNQVASISVGYEFGRK
ncbi:MAG TPA: outer membrane beta-barrel protein [Sphingobacterium sp.]|nr:outer membrane beta-barrel protein [Sphingobacterium sp.]